MNHSGNSHSTDASAEKDVDSGYTAPLPHCPPCPQVDKHRRQTHPIIGAEMKQSPADADRDGASVPMLTKKNLDKHNTQSYLRANFEVKQQFEKFKEAARSLGIDFPDQVLATMWQGLNGVTPMERFIAEKDDLLVLGMAGRAAGQEKLVHEKRLLEREPSIDTGSSTVGKSELTAGPSAVALKEAEDLATDTLT